MKESLEEGDGLSWRSERVRTAAQSRHVPEAELEAAAEGNGTHQQRHLGALSPSSAQETILVLDFGAQTSRLIARRVREAQVYCEILAHDAPWERIESLRPRGIILSGGPASVYEESAPRCDPRVFTSGIPVLGICYGMQLMAMELGGQVAPSQRREFGPAELEIMEADGIFQGLPPVTPVWMSHGDRVDELPPGFRPLGRTANSPIAAVGSDRGSVGLQFHPEVTHTPAGREMIENFVRRVCLCQGSWTPGVFVEETIAAIGQLSQHFDDAWLSQALRAGHPLIWDTFTNRAPWTRSRLCDFAEAIEVVARLPGSDKLKRRFGQPDQVEDAIFELDVAARALHRGLHVVLEPPTRGNRSTDLSVSTPPGSRSSIYIEVSRLTRMTRTERQAEAIMHRVFPTVDLLGGNLEGGGRFLRVPDVGQETNDLIQRAIAFWDERERLRDRAELTIPGLVQMWGASRDDKEAAQYFEDRGMPKDFSGPPILTKPYERLRERIVDKIERQLPTLAAGMLVLEPPWSLAFGSVDVIWPFIENLICQYRQVNALAIIRRLPSNDEPQCQVRQLGRGHVVITSPRFLIHAEETLLVRNPLRAHRAADAVIHRLFE